MIKTFEQHVTKKAKQVSTILSKFVNTNMHRSVFSTVLWIIYYVSV